MSFSKREFAKLIRTIVKKEIREVVTKELKPLIREQFSLLKEELFYTEDNSQQIVDSVSTTGLVNEENYQHEQEPSQKLFSKNGSIYDILNRTVNEVRTEKTTPQAPPGQILVDADKLNEYLTQDSGRPNQIVETQQQSREFRNKLMERMELSPTMAAGSSVNVPATSRPSQVQIPSTSPDGRPIDLNKVSPKVIGSLVRNYRPLMEAIERKKGNR